MSTNNTTIDFGITRGLQDYLDRFYGKAILLVIEESTAGHHDWKHNSFSLAACSSDKMLGSLVFNYPDGDIDVNEIVKPIKNFYLNKNL